MSWGGLPWWVYQLESEHYEAKLSGCMEDEWIVRHARSFPQYLDLFYK